MTPDLLQLAREKVRATAAGTEVERARADRAFWELPLSILHAGLLDPRVESLEVNGQTRAVSVVAEVAKILVHFRTVMSPTSLEPLLEALAANHPATVKSEVAHALFELHQMHGIAPDAATESAFHVFLKEADSWLLENERVTARAWIERILDRWASGSGAKAGWMIDQAEGAHCPKCGSERITCDGGFFEFTRMRCLACGNTQTCDSYQIDKWSAP